MTDGLKTSFSFCLSICSITAFEPFIRRETQLLLDRCDELCSKAKDSNKEGPRGLKGYAWFDALEMLNYWAFDTIGVLAFVSSMTP